MKSKKCSFLMGLLAARAAMLMLKLLKRNGTHYPGYLALKFCPDFLSYLAQPKKLIAITGTNGKTTSSNLILEVFQQTKLSIAHNSLGSNIQEGIITTLLRGSSFFGTKPIVDLVILEVDERVSPKIFPYIKPDILLITNLFRDSYRRNASVEFIADILDHSIPKSTKLVVNGDDVISSYLCRDNERFVFNMEALKNEPQIKDSLIKDVVSCPVCDQKLNYTFNRYHHIGRLICPKCMFTNLKSNIAIINVDDKVHIAFQDKVYYFPKIGENVTDFYNMTSAIATCIYAGLEMDFVQKSFESLKVVKSRFNPTPLNNKNIIVMMSKDQNPVAASRVFDYIRRQNERKTAVIFINENSDHHSGSENTAYYYDANFEYLNQDHIVQVIVGGWRILDAKVRLLLAGISETKIYLAHDEVSTHKMVDLNRVDDVYILYGTKTEPEALEIRDLLLKQIKQESHA